MAAVQSSRNPFRDPALTPQPTGESGVSELPESLPQIATESSSTLAPAPPLPARRTSTAQSGALNAVPPALPARSTPNRASTPPTTAPDNSDSLSILNEELPPPYSAGPAEHEGETTLEYGPSRPHAPPPPRPVPSNSYLSPQTTGSYQAPQHNGQWQNVQNSVLPPRPSPLSQWRDLAAQITGQVNSLVDDRRSNSFSTYPGQRPLHRGYAPPTGPPPQGRSTSNFYASERPTSNYQPPPGPPPPSTRPRSAPPTPDASNGRPTVQPTPGHPLLHEGKILIYPEGYQCAKCNNTGYKHADPLRPCSKCWKKHSKLFSGALTYLDFSAGRPPEPGKTLQRPLPAGVGPPRHPRNDMPNQQAHAYRPPPLPPQPPIRPLNRYQHAPAHAIVYPPGDPRIGGRPCPRCGGRGKEMPRGFLEMMFDEENTCTLCHGIGRVFN